MQIAIPVLPLSLSFMIRISNFFGEVGFFLRRRIFVGFTIPQDNIVVDIGSGDKPFWRADVFLDDLKLKNIQRDKGGNTITDLGLFINGTILKTKFKNKAFDFSYCTHLLEHVQDPARAIKEIMRISKSGYIEVPNGILEFIWPFPSHLWLIFYIKNQLIFMRKSKNLHSAMAENGIPYHYLYKNIHNPFIQLYWKKEINYKIIDPGKSSTNYSVKKDSEHNAEGTTKYYVYFVKVLRKLFLKKKNITRSTLLLSQ